MCRHLSVHRLLLALLIALSALGGAWAQESGNEHRTALLAEITGVIGPATAHYVQNAVDEAHSRQAEVLILRLDTPGGLLTSTREIVESILASPVPVIGYVAPSGAHAASAGTYILYATSIAAMAPGTNIGAATPVQIGGGGLPGLPPANDPQPAAEKSKGEERTRTRTRQSPRKPRCLPSKSRRRTTPLR